MVKTRGVNVELAMKHLATIGLGPKAVAEETGVTLRTARRWAQGRQQPRRSNLELLARQLRRMCDDATWRQLPRRWVPALEAALGALTPTPAAKVADLGEKRRQKAAWKADAARWEQRHADRGPAQSVTAGVDPFALIGEAA